MKKIILLVISALILISCEKSSSNSDSFLTARVVGYDMNCSTCILEFPYDSLLVSEEIGGSMDNYYQAVNLGKSSYEIGQLLRIRIRKPQADELKACITLFPSFNYQELYVSDVESFDEIIFGKPLNIALNSCLSDEGTKIYLCMDSVMNDSRCPKGVNCIWEGNAEVKFRFESSNDKSVFFSLNTHKGYTNDTIISGYKISLLDLEPYPVYGHRIDQKDYRAEVLIEKQ